MSTLQLVVQAARSLQRDELLRDLLQRDHLALGLRANIITVAHVHRLTVKLFLADNYTNHHTSQNICPGINGEGGRTKNEVILRDLAVTNLLVECLGAVIDVGEQPEGRTGRGDGRR